MVRKFCIKSRKFRILFEENQCSKKSGSREFYFALLQDLQKSLVGRGNVVSENIYEGIDFCNFITSFIAKRLILFLMVREVFFILMNGNPVHDGCPLQIYICRHFCMHHPSSHDWCNRAIISTAHVRKSLSFCDFTNASACVCFCM